MKLWIFIELLNFWIYFRNCTIICYILFILSIVLWVCINVATNNTAMCNCFIKMLKDQASVIYTLFQLGLPRLVNRDLGSLCVSNWAEIEKTRLPVSSPTFCHFKVFFRRETLADNDIRRVVISWHWNVSITFITCCDQHQHADW